MQVVEAEAGDLAGLTLEEALKHELARLGKDPNRAPSVAPMGDANAVFDLDATIVDPDGSGAIQPTGIRLTWTEQCSGDYDQNGEVNEADLVPLGLNLGRKVSYDDPELHIGDPFWPCGDPDGQGAANWRLARIDGDRNGEINVADVTAIAQHWHEVLDGYLVYWRRPGSQLYQIHSNLEDPDSPVSVKRSQAISGLPGSPLANWRVKYEIYYPATVPGNHSFRVSPYHIAEESEGPFSNFAGVLMNSPPTARAWAAPDVAYVPVDVEFKIEFGSHDDGKISFYEWDWDGDGVYDYNSGPETTVVHTYETLQEKQPVLRVTDNEGASSTFEIALTLLSDPGPPHWRFVEVGEANRDLTATDSGQLAEINGKPAFIYLYQYEASEQRDPEFRYYVAEDNMGVQWKDPVAFHPIRQYPEYDDPKLIEVRDVPAIAFRGGDGQTQNRDILFRPASERDGSVWWAEERIVANGNVWGISLFDASGAPAIGYMQYDDGYSLWSVSSYRSEYWLSWDDPVQVNQPGTQVAGPMLAGMAGDRPAMLCFNYYYLDLYIDPNSTMFHFFRAADSLGQDWQYMFTYQDYGIQPEGQYAEVDGRPAVVFEQRTEDYTNKVVFMRADDQLGTSWSLPHDVVVGTVALALAGDVALADVQGKPAVLFQEETADSLSNVYFSQSVDTFGIGWNIPQLLWENCSWDMLQLITINGHPCVLFDQNKGPTGEQDEKLIYGVYF